MLATIVKFENDIPCAWQAVIDSIDDLIFHADGSISLKFWNICIFGQENVDNLIGVSAKPPGYLYLDGWTLPFSPWIEDHILEVLSQIRHEDRAQQSDESWADSPFNNEF